MFCETLQYNKILINSGTHFYGISSFGDLTFKVIIDLLFTPELIQIIF